MQPVTGHVRRIIHPDDDLNRSAVYIGEPRRRRGFRGSPYATPFRPRQDGTLAEILRKYRHWLTSQPALVERAKRELRGRTLSCFCAPSRWCHGFILLDVIGDTAAPAATKMKDTN
jgi:hypothetical protein